jgi:hypothetical protein
MRAAPLSAPSRRRRFSIFIYGAYAYAPPLMPPPRRATIFRTCRLPFAPLMPPILLLMMAAFRDIQQCAIATRRAPQKMRGALRFAADYRAAATPPR